MFALIIRFFMARLREKSTWVGLVAVATAVLGPLAGLVLDHVGTLVLAILGAGLVTLPTTDVVPVVSEKHT